MTRGSEFKVDSPYFRVRSDRELKIRFARIGKARGCDPTNAAREGLVAYAATEEKRLGLPPVPPGGGPWPPPEDAGTPVA